LVAAAGAVAEQRLCVFARNVQIIFCCLRDMVSQTKRVNRVGTMQTNNAPKR
jgi:hypothetical protein